MYNNMLETDLSSEINAGGVEKPADSVRGKTMHVPAEKLKGLEPGWAHAQTEQLGDAIDKKFMKLDSSQTWIAKHIRKVKENVPDFSRARPSTVAKHMAYDYNHLEAARAANENGNLVTVQGEDGRSTTGIVARDGEGNDKRQGIWTSLDTEGRVRQIAAFQDGKPHGQFTNYAESGQLIESGVFERGKPTGFRTRYRQDGEAIHRTEYDKDGKVVKDYDIDPAQAAKQRADVRKRSAVEIGR